MIASLSDVPLFAGLTPADCAEIERRMARRDFPPQSALVREGSAGDAAFLILSGRVSVRRRDPETGIEFELAELGPRAQRPRPFQDAAVAEGMVDLRRYAALLLTEGLTTVEEVTSVVSVRE